MQVGNDHGTNSVAQCHQICHCEEAAGRRGNLGKAVANSPGAFPCSGRCCEIATAPAEPRNDKLGSAFFPCHCEEGASPTRQSREGSCEFAGGLPMLRLHPARLPRLLRSLAMTNLGVPSSRVIARRAQARRGNLGKAVANSPEAFPCYGCILRDCHGSCGASQ